MGSVSQTSTPLSDLFTIRQTALLLGRSEYSIWYHARNNLHPEPQWRGKTMLLTRAHLVALVQEHLRLRADESREELLKRVQGATAS